MEIPPKLLQPFYLMLWLGIGFEQLDRTRLPGDGAAIAERTASRFVAWRYDGVSGVLIPTTRQRFT